MIYIFRTCIYIYVYASMRGVGGVYVYWMYEPNPTHRPQNKNNNANQVQPQGAPHDADAGPDPVRAPPAGLLRHADCSSGTYIQIDNNVYVCRLGVDGLTGPCDHGPAGCTNASRPARAIMPLPLASNLNLNLGHTSILHIPSIRWWATRC